MRRVCIILIAILCAAPLIGKDIVVLRVNSLVEDGGRYKLELASGNAVWVDASDIHQELTNAVSEALEAQERASRIQSTASPPSLEEAQSMIRSKCTSEWEDNFRMRAYCEKQQRESLQALQGRTMNSPAGRKIRTECASEWQGDFRMRNYCEEQQLKALRSLQ